MIAQSDYHKYYLNINKSKEYSNVDSILKYRLAAINYAKPLPKDLLNISFYLYEKGDVSKSSHFFCRAFKNGYQVEPDENYKDLPFKIEYDFGFIDRYIDSKTRYANFMSFMYKKNKKRIKKIRKKFIKQIDEIDDARYEVLLQNELNFQRIRMDILPNKVNIDSVTLTLHKYLNIGNSYYMLDLLKNDEFPNRYKCRRFNEQNINILLNHAIASFATKEDAKQFVDLLWKQVEIGNIIPYDYAKAIDHYTQWYENSERSLLGTTTTSEDFKTFQCVDVLYPEKLDELRDSFWLESIELFCDNTGFKMPNNYVNTKK